MKTTLTRQQIEETGLFFATPNGDLMCGIENWNIVYCQGYLFIQSEECSEFDLSELCSDVESLTNLIAIFRGDVKLNSILK